MVTRLPGGSHGIHSSYKDPCPEEQIFFGLVLSIFGCHEVPLNIIIYIITSLASPILKFTSLKLITKSSLAIRRKQVKQSLHKEKLDKLYSNFTKHANLVQSECLKAFYIRFFFTLLEKPMAGLKHWLKN